MKKLRKNTFGDIEIEKQNSYRYKGLTFLEDVNTDNVCSI